MQVGFEAVEIIDSQSVGTHQGGTRGYAAVGLLLMCMILASCSLSEQTSASLSGALTLAGSTALQPLVTQAARLFMKQYPHIRVDVKGGGILAGLSAVTSHHTDIGNSDVYADPAIYPDPNLTDHLVCVIPFVMIVNHDVSLSIVRKQDIIDIFSTVKITNWSQLGGPNLAIVPVVRPATSGTRATFRKYILLATARSDRKRRPEILRPNALPTSDHTSLRRANNWARSREKG